MFARFPHITPYHARWRKSRIESVFVIPQGDVSLANREILHIAGFGVQVTIYTIKDETLVF